MKSFFKKLSFVMALAMVVTLAAPAAKSALAATEFTYAEQETGKKVTSLNMKVGEKVDLKFVGVKDYKNFTLNWQSSNPSVATVDKNGVITAVDNGLATVTLVVGDGSVYTSKAVTVAVGQAMNVVLGTAKDNTFTAYTLNLGETVDLNFYGVTDWKAGKYDCNWVSSDAKVATVDNKGIVTPVAAGDATITVAIVDKATGASLTVVPVVITVPEVKPVTSYTVKQISDTKFTLTFDGTVAEISDITLARVYDGDGGIEVVWPIKEAKVSDNVITVTPYVTFANGDQYIVRVGADDEGTAFTTKIGAVDQLVVTYKSLNTTGVAYTNGEDGEEVTVTFDVKLYSQGVDVTAVRDNDKTDVVYTLLTENENINIDEYGGTIAFYKAGIAATVVATYTYFDADNNEKTVQQPINMTSVMAPAYKVTGVKAWTIVKENQEKIDWSNPVHSLAAFDEDAAECRIVALITDNYGNTVVTDDTFADSNAKIAALTGSRFEAEGYSVVYSSANTEKLLVGEDGVVTTYTTTTTPAIVALYNSNVDTNGGFVRNLSALPITVKAQRTINKVEVSDGSLTLVTEGAFTDGSVKVVVYDQYGDIWTKEAVLSVSSSVEGVSVGDITYLAGNKKATLTLDGGELKSQMGTKTSTTLTLKEGTSGKTAAVRVTLKSPKFEKDSDGNEIIKVTSWSLSATSVDQAIAKEADGTEKKATIGLYELSNSLKVGISSDFGVAYSADDLKLDDQVIKRGDKVLVVYAPNGSIVKEATGGSLGIKVNEDHTLSVVVAAPNEKDVMQYLATGTYTVKVLEVSSIDKKGSAVFRTKYSTTFAVTNTSKAVTFSKQDALETEEEEIEAIVKDTLLFKLGGSNWDFKEGDIKEVSYRQNSSAGYIVITSVTFQVPLNGDDDTVGYTAPVNVNKSVKVPEGFWQ